MRKLAVIALMFCAGCASYVTPGGPARLAELNGADVADVADPGARPPSPHFPVRFGVVRVQAPAYRSRSVRSLGEGRFSIVETQELLDQAQLKAIANWPVVAKVATLDGALLPARLESLDDLRLAAAKIQADILLVYTLDTAFRLQGQPYGPAAKIALAESPGREAGVTSTASALFVDVRTGFIYGSVQASGAAVGLDQAWRSVDSLDGKRLEAERQAAAALLSEGEKTWNAIAGRYR